MEEITELRRLISDVSERRLLKILYTVVKKRTPVTFSNNSNKSSRMTVIFGIKDNHLMFNHRTY